RSESSILQKKGYVLGPELGQGSYAVVKSATWQKPGSTDPLKVALKIINGPQVPQDFKDKFLPRELDIVKILNHDNVIRTMEIFTGGRKTYLSLEFAGRGDMLGYIQMRGALEEKESATLFKQLVNGVGYLHANGVVHRDLKCENVLLSNRNRIKVADFGFSRKMSLRDLSMTFCGSAAYAAPEILQGIPYRGPAADLWSMGVILFVMNCAIMPFRDNSMKTLLLDQKLPLRYTDKLDKSLTDKAKEIMQGLLVFDADKRLRMHDVAVHSWLKQAVKPDSAADSAPSKIEKLPSSTGNEATNSETNK
uniref:non-specific serine/threonine protein kinase n=2 Tax=Ciona intestinalis TaxID=7719 RepID=F6U667_CIOIN